MSVAVSSEKFSDEVLKASEPVLVDFWATWCGPCRTLAPTIDRVSNTFGDQVKVVKVDVDEAPDIASEYGVRSIPTVVIFREGKEVTRWVGVQPEAKYTAELQRLLG